MPGDRYFAPAAFKFLEELGENNNREWFQANKARYEKHIKEAAFRFIVDFAPRLKKISPHFRADPRAVGGSLFRIYRDTRFSKDKSPYKTYTGIQFRHEAAKDAHAPGFYLHLQPGEFFMGAGIWHPDGATLRKIRDYIVENPGDWKRNVHGKKLAAHFDLAGDSLVRAPKGYDPEHPLIEDLRRKDFIGITGITKKMITSDDLLDWFTAHCKGGTPLMRTLCKAVGVPY